MKKITYLFVAGLGFTLLAGCSYKYQGSTRAVPAQVVAPTQEGLTSITPHIDVIIKNFAFVSDALSIAVGSTVIWRNLDSVTHTITSDAGLFDQTLAPNETFSYAFDKAGTYAYHCTIHSSMVGKVVVQ